jgi:hypothetical protein
MRALILLAALGLAYLGWRWFRKQPPGSQLRLGAIGAGVALVLLAATGRLPWMFALLGAAVPVVLRLASMLPYIPTLQRLLRQFGGGRAPRSQGGQQSAVETRWLRMVLDHDTGEMSGQVLAGPHAGQALSALSLDELLDLLAECEGEDEQSGTLLRTYLDRTHGPEWQDRAEARAGGRGGWANGMSRREAYEILGLAEGASDEAIRAAHRRLMQKLHPDRGGSTFLAAKINQAKAVLLGEV